MGKEIKSESVYNRAASLLYTQTEFALILKALFRIVLRLYLQE